MEVSTAVSHHALVDRVRALVRVHVARDDQIHAVLIEQILQVFLEVGRQLPGALGGVVGLMEANNEPPAQCPPRTLKDLPLTRLFKEPPASRRRVATVILASKRTMVMPSRRLTTANWQGLTDASRSAGKHADMTEPAFEHLLDVCL